MLVSTVTILVLYSTLNAITAAPLQTVHRHHLYKIVPAEHSNPHKLHNGHLNGRQLHKRSIDKRQSELPLSQSQPRGSGELLPGDGPKNLLIKVPDATGQVRTAIIQVPAGVSQARTAGLIDKLSEGIAHGLSAGLSTGISSGVTNSIYALPDAIAGTLNNLKNPYYGGSGLSYGGASGLGGFSGDVYSSSISPGLSYGSSSLSNGIPYGSLGSSSYSLGPQFSSFGSEGSGVYSISLPGGGYLGNSFSGSGSSGIYSSLPGHLFFGGSSYLKKPLGGGHSPPYHWDCKLIPATGQYGNLYKSAGEPDDVQAQVENLSELIQNSQDARSNGEPIRTLELSRSNAPLEFKSNIPLVETRMNNVDDSIFLRNNNNFLREMEERKNMALLEEMNLSMPSLAMVDPSKLVGLETMGRSQQGNLMGPNDGSLANDGNVVVLLVPLPETNEQTLDNKRGKGQSMEMNRGNGQTNDRNKQPLAETQKIQTQQREYEQNDEPSPAESSIVENHMKAKESEMKENIRDNLIEDNHENLETQH